MGMTISVAITDPSAAQADLDAVYALFTAIDERFSTYKKTSEISRLNRGDIKKDASSEEMREVLALCEETKHETHGYFDIQRPDGTLDPSGLVKGWAIQKAAELLDGRGFQHYFVDAGGDIQSRGVNGDGKPWSVGVRHPSHPEQIVQVIYPNGRGVATSGTYIRGQHIYNPKDPTKPITDVVSLTVIGPNVYEADRFATAAFAMGLETGMTFLMEKKLEAMAITPDARVFKTPGFDGTL